MKALILGNDAMIAGIGNFINGFGQEGMQCYKSSAAAAIAGQQRMDIALVDASLGEADAVCNQVHSR